MTPRSRNQIVAEINALEQEASGLDPDAFDHALFDGAEADPAPATPLDRLKVADGMMTDALRAVIGTSAYFGTGNDFGPDTAFAMGEAAGAIGKAKALLGRDIDNLERAVCDAALP